MDRRIEYVTVMPLERTRALTADGSCKTGSAAPSGWSATPAVVPCHDSSSTGASTSGGRPRAPALTATPIPPTAAVRCRRVRPIATGRTWLLQSILLHLLCFASLLGEHPLNRRPAHAQVLGDVLARCGHRLSSAWQWGTTRAQGEQSVGVGADLGAHVGEGVEVGHQWPGSSTNHRVGSTRAASLPKEVSASMATTRPS